MYFGTNFFAETQVTCDLLLDLAFTGVRFSLKVWPEDKSNVEKVVQYEHFLRRICLFPKLGLILVMTTRALSLRLRTKLTKLKDLLVKHFGVKFIF